MAIQLGNQFTAISASDYESPNPPNSQVAVSSTTIVVPVNWRCRLFNKSGQMLDDKAGRDFMSSGGDYFDARGFYNPIIGKFLIAGIDLDSAGNVSCIAMLSNNSSPATLGQSDWQKIVLGIGYDTDNWGYTADCMAVVFGDPSGQMVRLYAGGMFNHVVMPTALQTGSAPAVAMMPDSLPGDPLWMVRLASTSDYLELWNVTIGDGVPNFAVYEVPFSPKIYPWNDEGARQPSGGPFFPGTANGNCIVRTVNGKKYLYYCCMGGNFDRSVCVYWWVIDVTGLTPVLHNKGYTDALSMYDFSNPAIAANKQGTFALTMLWTGPSFYPQNMCWVRGLNDPQWSKTICNNSQIPFVGGRIGDYPGLCCDETDGSFYSANQIPIASPSTYNWSIPIQQFSLV